MSMLWRKSSKCKTDEHMCVEISNSEGVVFVRNSKVPGKVIAFDIDEWAAFTEGVKNNEFSF